MESSNEIKLILKHNQNYKGVDYKAGDTITGTAENIDAVKANMASIDKKIEAAKVEAK